MKKVTVISLFLLLCIFLSTSFAVEVTWFGEYFRTPGKPEMLRNHFSAMPGGAQIVITNGDVNGFNRASSAKIVLNGEQIVGPSNFNQQTYQLQLPVSLEENNWISIQLASKPGSHLTVEVIQEVDSNVSIGNAEIPPTTKWIGEENSQYLISVSNDESTYVFNENIQNDLPLEIGSVIIFGINSLTPSGALRKITSIQHIGDEIIVETVQATLAEAIANCDISIKFKLEPPSPSVLTRNIDSSETSVGADFNIPWNNKLIYDGDGNLSTTYDQVRSTGNLNFSYEVELDIVIDWFNLEYLVFTNTVSENAQIEVAVSGALSFEKKEEIAKLDLPSFPVWILVFDPELGINVGVNGEVYTELTTGITQESSFTAGLEYSNGSWNPVSDFTKNDFDYQEPSISGRANVCAYAGPQLELLLYGVTGPYAQVRGYLDFAADLFSDPCWELNAGLAVDVGIKIEAFDWTIAEIDWPGVIVIDVPFPLDGSPLAEGECDCHEFDTDCDGCISIEELMVVIEQWKAGEVSILELMEAIAIWKECTSANTLSDEFEDGIIDTNLWVTGGAKRGWNLSDPSDTGSWNYSHEEITDPIDGYLNMRVWGPASGNTYGAEAWVRTSTDFNDGANHIINFTWEPEFIDYHYNTYFIQVTDGYISPENTLHWALSSDYAGTVNLLWDEGSRGLSFENEPSPGKLNWSITIDPSGVVCLYDSPYAAGTLMYEGALDLAYPWYVRFMVSDGTSAGFPAGDARLKLLDFAAVSSY